jgi:hypothetical protein
VTQTIILFRVNRNRLQAGRQGFRPERLCDYLCTTTSALMVSVVHQSGFLSNSISQVSFPGDVVAVSLEVLEFKFGVNDSLYRLAAVVS